MTLTPTQSKEAHQQGFADACDWLEDERRRLRTADPEDDGSLADVIRDALRPGRGGPHEALLNALTDSRLDALLGFASRDAEGCWTASAEEWFHAYDRGWREALNEAVTG